MPLHQPAAAAMMTMMMMLLLLLACFFSMASAATTTKVAAATTAATTTSSCTGNLCQTTAIAASGSIFHPTPAGYYCTTGTASVIHRANLRSPTAGADIDLYFLQWDATAKAWVVKTSATTGGATESASFTAGAGCFAWRVASVQAATYTIDMIVPELGVTTRPPTTSTTRPTTRPTTTTTKATSTTTAAATTTRATTTTTAKTTTKAAATTTRATTTTAATTTKTTTTPATTTIKATTTTTTASAGTGVCQVGSPECNCDAAIAAVGIVVRDGDGCLMNAACPSNSCQYFHNDNIYCCAQGSSSCNVTTNEDDITTCECGYTGDAVPGDTYRRRSAHLEARRLRALRQVSLKELELQKALRPE